MEESEEIVSEEFLECLRGRVIPKRRIVREGRTINALQISQQERRELIQHRKEKDPNIEKCYKNLRSPQIPINNNKGTYPHIRMEVIERGAHGIWGEEMLKSQGVEYGGEVNFTLSSEGVLGGFRETTQAQERKGRCTIGRLPYTTDGHFPNDIVISPYDLGVSRTHCCIEYGEMISHNWRIPPPKLAFLHLLYMDTDSAASSLPSELLHLIFSYLSHPRGVYITDLNSKIGTFIHPVSDLRAFIPLHPDIYITEHNERQGVRVISQYTLSPIFIWFSSLLGGDIDIHLKRGMFRRMLIYPDGYEEEEIEGIGEDNWLEYCLNRVNTDSRRVLLVKMLGVGEGSLRTSKYKILIVCGAPIRERPITFTLSPDITPLHSPVRITYNGRWQLLLPPNHGPLSNLWFNVGDLPWNLIDPHTNQELSAFRLLDNLTLHYAQGKYRLENGDMIRINKTIFSINWDPKLDDPLIHH